MGIIYRPNRGMLNEAMKEVRYFESFENLQRYIVEDMKHYIDLKPEEVVSSGKPIFDERIGWLDSGYLCIDSYEKISDKVGYVNYFGGKFNHPVCIGAFATQWNRDQPNGIIKNSSFDVKIPEV